MGVDADTYLVDTSAGELNVQYGWEGWAVVQASGGRAFRAVVRNRQGLQRLLVDAGVTESEARWLAPGLWKGRPRGIDRAGVADPWADPWKRQPNFRLALFLLGLVAAFVYIVVAKLDWVAV
jgi:hypothetical protein